MWLFENFSEKFLNRDKKKSKNKEPESVIYDFDEEIDFAKGFEAYLQDTPNNYSYSYKENQTPLVGMQAEKISSYRRSANLPDLSSCIDEIVNEILYTENNDTPLKLDFNSDNNDLKKSVTKGFKHILELLNNENTLYNFVRTTFIDGQIVIFVSYSKDTTLEQIKKQRDKIMKDKGIEPSDYDGLNSYQDGDKVIIDGKVIKGINTDINEDYDFTSSKDYEEWKNNKKADPSFLDIDIGKEINGKIIKRHIQKISLLEPSFLIYDKNKKQYYYANKTTNLFNDVKYEKSSTTFDLEEIIKGDFGYRTPNGLILSHIEKGMKTANLLKTLEDLLVPLRFSRSISRRVFNVDVSKLPPRKATEVLKSMADKLKYKKSYNPETGEVTNDQHVVSMVEDYFFSNRDGSKGVQVDTIDETGNLGELNDILYFVRKLYRSMGIPSSRINLEGDAVQFDFDNNSIDHDELKFQHMINRFRKTYTKIIKELLRRELIYNGTLKNDDEWDEIEQNINIYFSGENVIFEKLKIQNFKDRVEMFKDMSDLAGKHLPFKYIYKKVLKLSDDEIKQLKAEIRAEKTDEDYTELYNDGY